ncbi:HAD hydrolase-like protein [Neorhizobium galegae]|nr:HAD hydrolase-like protein [Neorhizobium galegae]
MTGRPAADIEADIRRVHQARRTSEYSFLLEEIDALADLRATGDIRDSFSDAIDLSRRGRDLNLSLYPSVFRCLWELKKKGTKIVAYTESMGFYSAYRLKRFGLDGVIDVMFSPQDHDLPAGVSVENLRRLPDEFYELQVTEMRHTPPGELKPNPTVLLDILKTVGAHADRCAYVGDSLFKDVVMARAVGVFDIHAKYGESQRRPEYSLLQRVSHWTDADVQRERAIIAKGHDFEPSAVLKESFAEIFMHCDFEAFSSGEKKPDSELEIKNALEVWKKTVDVQQHFNDLEMRIRNFAITVVGALIAAVGYTYQQGLQANILGHQFAAGLGFIVAALFAWFAFFLIDYYWYHVFLRGAVKHAGKIEKAFKDRIPSIDLGSTISSESQAVKIFGLVPTNSEMRLKMFYWLGFGMIGVVFLTLLLATQNKPTTITTATTTSQNAQPGGKTEGK